MLFFNKFRTATEANNCFEYTEDEVWIKNPQNGKLEKVEDKDDEGDKEGQ